MNELITNISKILKKHYPLSISLNQINTLSHFWIDSHDLSKFLSIRFNIDGMILNGQYKNIVISCPIEQFISCSIKKMDWNRYWIEN